MKIMIMTENPHFHTGMALVGREIACYLATHGFEVIYGGWGISGKPNDFPFMLYEFARDKIVQCFDEVILKERPQYVLTIGDAWMTKFMADPQECRSRNYFQWVNYIAVDGLNINNEIPTWWNGLVNNADYLIAYTDYGQRALQSAFFDYKIPVIEHGICERTFFPLDKQECRKELKLPEDKFIFLFVGRNQPRKNIPELFKIWKEYIKHDKNALLFTHFNFNDPAGIPVEDFLFEYGLYDSHTIIFMEKVAYSKQTQYQVTPETLNKIYNASDAYINISSEGFGLPIGEAMATKTPCLLLDHSAGSCLGACGRAEFIKVGFKMTGMYKTECTFPSIEDAVQKMLKIRNADNTEMVENAYNYIRTLTWNKIGEKWATFFNKVDAPFNYPLILEEVTA